MHFSRKSILTLVLAGAFALPALAGDRATPLLAERRGDHLPRLERLFDCLTILQLSDEQRAEIRAVLEAARPEFQSNRESLRAAREKLSADVAAGADACVVGQDYFAVHAALESLRAQLSAVRDQVLSKLPAEEAARLAGCLEGLRFD
jgi:Spy/CpxP family protein refolding chaperone